MSPCVLTTQLPFPKRSGKVRDVYDLGDRLLIVSTDRISAFDYILPNGIPDKGKVLTKMSCFWFGQLPVANHLISDQLPTEVLGLPEAPLLEGRTMVVRKAQVVPFECVIRGYLEGSGWAEYQRNRSVCGVELPAGLVQCDRLPEAIFTPATKAESGHDENVSFAYMASQIGTGVAAQLRDLSMAVYQAGAKIAAEKGVIIADTKLEWGWNNDQLILVDEVLTPDSSRFWPAKLYQPGKSQPSLDKQFVREWLMQCGWDRNSPPPPLPSEVVEKTSLKYKEVLTQLTGSDC
jgi:phosphoribosylaminoimidazole-succinocarboxamide synthase